MGLALGGLVERWFHLVICRLDMFGLPEKIVFTVARFLINLRELIICLLVSLHTSQCLFS